jgi:hypothetical protein
MKSLLAVEVAADHTQEEVWVAAVVALEDSYKEILL